ncbi:hypothetical protein TH53_19875 [Pedobacter lusitanus]|uniref:Uncharacterized protein n=1 Tax=Pedobacter lusitanus TaxID=1503925 RepID=A0A0D0FT27_9SPHI|nr:hypothetical protein [Pedobacter lusitanus]KIO75599.1 hypothetical protein TH53_19875 [Pedobacter lusitanus]
MKVIHFKTKTSQKSSLNILIESKREKLFLMSLFSDTYRALEAANSEKTTHLGIGEEQPFTHEEVKEWLDKLYIAI